MNKHLAQDPFLLFLGDQSEHNNNNNNNKHFLSSNSAKPLRARQSWSEKCDSHLGEYSSVEGAAKGVGGGESVMVTRKSTVNRDMVVM